MVLVSRLWYSLAPPCRGGSNEYPQSMFWAQIWKTKLPEFLSEHFHFLVVQFTIYLNMRVFVMNNTMNRTKHKKKKKKKNRVKAQGDTKAKTHQKLRLRLVRSEKLRGAGSNQLFRCQISDYICRLLFLYIHTNHRLERSSYVKLKDWMSNSVDPDETAHNESSHLDLRCLQKPIIIACGSERVKFKPTYMS